MYDTTTNSSAPFSQMVTPSEEGNRLNRRWCSCQIISRIANVIANTGSPRITCISSSNELGTSRETTSRVMAKPNTASLNASRRVTSDEASAMRGDFSACGPRTARTRAVHFQLPTANFQGTPNPQLRSLTGTARWELDVGSALVVGNWKLGLGGEGAVSPWCARTP